MASIEELEKKINKLNIVYGMSKRITELEKRVENLEMDIDNHSKILGS